MPAKDYLRIQNAQSRIGHGSQLFIPYGCGPEAVTAGGRGEGAAFGVQRGLNVLDFFFERFVCLECVFLCGLRCIGTLGLAVDFLLQVSFVLLSRQAAEVVSDYYEDDGFKPEHHLVVGQRLEPPDQRRPVQRNENEGEDHHYPVLQNF